ncbi:hypothetical protein CLAIMM_09450 [Cladophialophora immunda]|nr:hypothetical protein CLAIMM_09450 [Cladophialophora immunda]
MDPSSIPKCSGRTERGLDQSLTSTWCLSACRSIALFNPATPVAVLGRSKLRIGLWLQRGKRKFSQSQVTDH